MNLNSLGKCVKSRDDPIKCRRRSLIAYFRQGMCQRFYVVIIRGDLQPDQSTYCTHGYLIRLESHSPSTKPKSSRSRNCCCCCCCYLLLFLLLLMSLLLSPLSNEVTSRGGASCGWHD